MAFSITAPAHPHTTGLCIRPYFFQWSPLSSIKVPDRHIDRLIPLYKVALFPIENETSRIGNDESDLHTFGAKHVTCVETDGQTNR